MPKALFTSTSGAGHLMPLFPVARAAQASGWDVTVAAPPETEAFVTSQGLPFTGLPGIPGDDPRRAEAMARMTQLPKEDGLAYFVREVFGRLNTSGTLPHMQRIVEELRPGIIVSEAAECSGGLVAEVTGTPWVRVHPGLTTLGFFERSLEEGLVELRHQLELPTDLEGHRARQPPNIAYMPAELEFPDEPAPETLRIRDPRYRARDDEAPDDMVYVTFGSEAAAMPFFTAVVQAAIDAVAELDVKAIVALGRHGNPDDFSAPPGVSISQWVDQAGVMGVAKAVVCHGGAGTVLAALSCGVPMVLVPLFADQPYNAARVAESRAGVIVSPGGDVAERLPAALQTVLQGPMPGAESLSKTIASFPGPEAAVEMLAGLSASREAESGDYRA